MKMKSLVGIAILFLCGTVQAQEFPFRNPSLSSAERADDLLARLTLEEKVRLMMDVSEEIPRLNVPAFAWWSEALHGFTHNQGVTAFPQNVGMAASFNDPLVEEVFDAVSDEIRARVHDNYRRGDGVRTNNGLSVWTPNVNIFRDPRWGRGQETYGEDPYLMSRMGIAVVRGLQGPDTARYRKLLACAKHYAVHSGPEWNRHSFNLTNLENRDLWETYMPAFKSVVIDGDVRQVMCAYQRLDDEPCCGSSRLLSQILRGEWGFERVVVSDCGAIRDFYAHHKVSSDALHASARAVAAGTDVECSDYTYIHLPEAVRRGLLPEADINRSVRRLLIERFDLGDFDPDTLVPWANLSPEIINCKEHRELALEMARQSMTLLQNKNNILPLRKNQRIAIVGPNADDSRMMWGNYPAIPARTITALAGIRALTGREVPYERGCDIVDDMILESLWGECSFDGKPGIRATYWNNKRFEGAPVTTVQYDHPIRLTTAGQHAFGPGVNLREFSGVYETVLTPSESGEIVFRLEALGFCELTVNGQQLADFTTWRIVPKRIAYAVEKGKDYRIELRFHQEFDFANAGLNFNFGQESPVNYEALIASLKGIDVVVFVGGISPELEGEEMPIEIPGFKGGDRTDIELPASQRNCIRALKEAGKKVILVHCSGSAVGLVPEAENCEAILQAWYAGESGGQAIAEVLFGAYNPAGKLPITFYRNLAQIPDYEDYSMQGRTYRYMTEAPLFRFGHGLSYTTFRIGEATADHPAIGIDDTVTLTIPVTNTGRRKGTEIVQVYVKKENEEGPLKTLRAYRRVELAPGETAQVSIELDRKAFEWYDEHVGRVVTTPGDFRVLYGNSSADEALKELNVSIL